MCGVYRWRNQRSSYCSSYVSHDASLISYHGYKCKCWRAYTEVLLFLGRPERYFRVCPIMGAVVVPCCVIVSDCATPHTEAVNVLARYSPARRPNRAWVHLTAARVAGRTLALSAKLCATSVLLWGFSCAEWVDGPSDLSLLRYRHCIDSRQSGVIWPSAQAVLCCSASLPRCRYCLGFARKGVKWPCAHIKPAALNLPQPRYCPD